MTDVPTELRITSLEVMISEMTSAVTQTTRTVERLSLEMSEFKDEMSEFKQEMGEFKDEMNDFKDEVRGYMERSDIDRRNLNKQLAEIANRQGRMAEDLVAPIVCRILREVLGFSEEELCVANVRVRRRDPSGKSIREFDVIAECRNYVLVNETKSRLSPFDVLELLKTIKIVRQYFPEFQERRIIGSLATLYVDSSLVKYATDQGILVLAVGDELMDVMNPADFKPKEH